jgi:hypothetical protein
MLHDERTGKEQRNGASDRMTEEGFTATRPEPTRQK